VGDLQLSDLMEPKQQHTFLLPEAASETVTTVEKLSVSFPFYGKEEETEKISAISQMQTKKSK